MRHKRRPGTRMNRAAVADSTQRRLFVTADSCPIAVNLLLLLAQAFDRAWDPYYEARRRVAISEEIARNSLARRLVALVKEGTKEEDRLAERGFQTPDLAYATTLGTILDPEGWRKIHTSVAR